METPHIFYTGFVVAVPCNCGRTFTETELTSSWWAPHWRCPHCREWNAWSPEHRQERIRRYEAARDRIAARGYFWLGEWAEHPATLRAIIGERRP
jgi:hypothetical protein